MKCSQCSKDKFVKMPICIHYSDGSYGGSSTSIDNLKAYLCINCGHIEFFSDKYKNDLAKIQELENQLAELYKKLDAVKPKAHAERMKLLLNKIREILDSNLHTSIHRNDKITPMRMELLNSWCINSQYAFVEQILDLEELLHRKKAAFAEFSELVQ